MPLVASQCCDRLKVKKTKKGKMNEIISRHFSTDQFCAVGVAQKLAVAFTQLQRAEQTEQTIARDGARLEERQKRRRNSTSSLVSKRKKETKKKKRKKEPSVGSAEMLTIPGRAGRGQARRFLATSAATKKQKLTPDVPLCHGRAEASSAGTEKEREREESGKNRAETGRARIREERIRE